MRDPYEVLGVPRGASIEQVKAAYRNLAKQYHPDNYTNDTPGETADDKMAELNDAYDAIMSNNSDASAFSSAGQSGSYTYGQGNARASQNATNDYSYIRSYISLGRLDEADRDLESIDPGARDAEWYYLKGQVNYSRGWMDQAFSCFTTAYRMNPSNEEYRRTYENFMQQRSGGYRTTRTGGGSSTDAACKICQGLICADCCCECMGGDLIPCC